MTFFDMTKALGGDGTLIAGVPEVYLVPISLGAVLCGAITYIGNGPNFMVKSVADADGVAMPSFGAYVGKAFIDLVPVLATMALIFIAEAAWLHYLGYVCAAVLIVLMGVRITRATRMEAAGRS